MNLHTIFFNLPGVTQFKPGTTIWDADHSPDTNFWLRIDSGEKGDVVLTLYCVDDWNFMFLSEALIQTRKFPGFFSRLESRYNYETSRVILKFDQEKNLTLDFKIMSDTRFIQHNVFWSRVKIQIDKENVENFIKILKGETYQ